MREKTVEVYEDEFKDLFEDIVIHQMKVLESTIMEVENYEREI